MGKCRESTVGTLGCSMETFSTDFFPIKGVPNGVEVISLEPTVLIQSKGESKENYHASASARASLYVSRNLLSLWHVCICIALSSFFLV